MSSPHPPFSKYLGKNVIDRYGRFKGKIVGLECAPNGELKRIIFENNGFIVSKNSDSFIINGEEIEVAPALIIKAEQIIKKLASLKLQYETVYMFKLKNFGGYSIYEYIMDDLDTAYEELKNNCESIINSLEHRKKSLEEKKKWMYKVLFQLEVARKLNQIEEDVYLTSYDKLETELFRISREIEDVEMLITEISLKLKDIEAIQSSQQQEIHEVNDDVIVKEHDEERNIQTESVEDKDERKNVFPR